MTHDRLPHAQHPMNPSSPLWHVHDACQHRGRVFFWYWGLVCSARTLWGTLPGHERRAVVWSRNNRNRIGSHQRQSEIWESWPPQVADHLWPTMGTSSSTNRPDLWEFRSDPSRAWSIPKVCQAARRPARHDRSIWPLHPTSQASSTQVFTTTKNRSPGVITTHRPTHPRWSSRFFQESQSTKSTSLSLRVRPKNSRRRGPIQPKRSSSSLLGQSP